MARPREIDWVQLAETVVSLIQENKPASEIEQFVGRPWGTIVKSLHRQGLTLTRIKEIAFDGMRGKWKKRSDFGNVDQVTRLIATGKITQNRWGFIVSENFYDRKMVESILGFRGDKIQNLIKAGKIKKLDRSVYDKESVDKYRAEMDERLAIGRADWIKRGNLT